MRSRTAVWYIAGVLVIAALGGFAFWKTRAAAAPKSQPAAADGPDTLRVGRHVFRVANENMGQGKLEIQTDGKPAQEIEGGSFAFSDLGQEDPVWHNGSDINGDGIPEVVIRESTGGAHCCISWRIFSAGPEVKQIYEFDNAHTDFFPLFDANGDGKYEIKRYDWTFAYWNAGFAQSPAVELIYAWENGAYRFSPTLTRKAPLSDEDLQKRVQDLDWDAPEPEVDVPAPYWANLLDLIGTGNAAQLADYVNAAWPSEKPGRAEFMAKFAEQLHKSAYWAELDKLNGGKLQELIEAAR